MLIYKIPCPQVNGVTRTQPNATPRIQYIVYPHTCKSYDNFIIINSITSVTLGEEYASDYYHSAISSPLHSPLCMVQMLSRNFFLKHLQSVKIQVFWDTTPCRMIHRHEVISQRT